MKYKILTLAAMISLCACKKGGSDSNASSSKVSVENSALNEGHEGTTNFEFSVTLDKAAEKDVTVIYTTVDGTAKAGEDYTAANDLSVVFKPGEVSKKVAIAVIGDRVKEDAETFSLILRSATNATVQKHTAIGTIYNDDESGNYTKLVWSEEFDGPALNTNVWTYEIGDGCPNLCGWGNNELEYYTNRPENLYFQNGSMVIEARKETMGNRNYTSARIISRDKKTVKFGRIDIRAKLPKGKGIWPALWLLPQSNIYGGWPRSGELDLMEMVGHEPNKVYGTLHYGPGPGSIQISRGYTLPSGTFADDYHVFSIVWDFNEIKWYVDGNLFSTASKSDFGANTYPFNEDFFFIINLAVGGNWPGNPDATTTFPQQFFVDYIRVYQ